MITCHFTGHSNCFGGNVQISFFYQKNCEGDYIRFGDILSENSYDSHANNYGKYGLYLNLSFSQFMELEFGPYCFYLRGLAEATISGEANLVAPTVRCTSLNWKD